LIPYFAGKHTRGLPVKECLAEGKCYVNVSRLKRLTIEPCVKLAYLHILSLC
jgi:hypothetical protein